MFAYCGNNPVLCVDRAGYRTYIINGINNEEEEDAPQYAKKFQRKLADLGIIDIRLIAVYNGQSGLRGIAQGVIHVMCEMLNDSVHTNDVVEQILRDLEEKPLETGEQLNIIGYSGGQIALNVADKLESKKVKVNNVVLIGALVYEATLPKARVISIFAWLDPLSWSIGGDINRSMGWIGHTDYFKNKYIDKLAKIINKYIN